MEGSPVKLDFEKYISKFDTNSPGVLREALNTIITDFNDNHDLFRLQSRCEALSRLTTDVGTIDKLIWAATEAELIDCGLTNSCNTDGLLDHLRNIEQH